MYSIRNLQPLLRVTIHKFLHSSIKFPAIYKMILYSKKYSDNTVTTIKVSGNNNMNSLGSQLFARNVKRITDGIRI